MPSVKGEKFETSLEKLEAIVRKLEEGDLSLEDSLKYFEEGMKLARLCETRLTEAQKKIEILVKNEEGKKVPRNFEPEETP
jgi:exodeoxyribonuclease VII small subunit